MSSNIEWKWAELPLEESVVKQVELKLKVKFPKDYISIVLKYNSGNPSKRCFDFNNRKDVVFDSLLNLNEGGDDPSLIETYNNVKDRLPKKIVPFASDPFGNLICFNFNKNPASICFWDHEISAINIDKSITPVSKSFTDLLNMLK